MREWRKSSKSTTNACVEVSRTSHGEVWVRDSKDDDSPILAFNQDEWEAFITAVKDGEFDLAKVDA